MKTRSLKTVLLIVAAFTVTVKLTAQKPTRNARSRTGYTSGYGTSGYTTTNAARDTTKKKNANTAAPSGYGNPASGYGNNNASGTGGNNTSGYGNTGNAAATGTGINQSLPMKVISGSGSGIGDSVAPSLRTDNAIDRQLVKDRTPLA